MPKPNGVSPWSTSSVATEAPLEKSTIECAEAKRTSVADGMSEVTGPCRDRVAGVSQSWGDLGGKARL